MRNIKMVQRNIKLAQLGLTQLGLTKSGLTQLKLPRLQPTKMSVMMLTALTATATAQPFVVSGYEFLGLNRVAQDQLLPLLPPQGQVIDERELSASIHRLYATGQFADIKVANNNGVVQYTVSEYPIVAEIGFEGNTLIPKQGLEAGIGQAGLVVGSPLNPATLNRIVNELKAQYTMQGYYNSDISVEQTPLQGNRVKLNFRFVEGEAARVVDINLIGNQYFSDDEIKDVLLLKEKSWNFLSKADRYAQDKFQASLDALIAKYLDAGFARFDIENASLTINEDKDSVAVELQVNEGERYRFGQTQFLGDVYYPKEQLQKLMAYEADGYYSRAKITQTINAINNKFGDDGFYFAEVRPVPRIDDKTHTVAIDYYIDPKRPVYVRRINFSGNIKTKDEVLRREMRQLEGALASNEKIQLSRARLMRTGYFKNVTVQTRPIANTPDQMDIDFVVEEQPSGSATVAAGYSQSGGVTFQLDFSQNNFLGTGNKVNANFSRSQTLDAYSLGYNNPYFTTNGVSQNVSAYYRKTKADKRNISNYVLDTAGGSLIYGYPIDENQRISAGININQNDLHGGRFMALSNVNQLLKDGGKAEFDGDTTSFSNKEMSYNAVLGWNYSSLDKPVFPTQGMSHSVNLTVGTKKTPYQKVTYDGSFYEPLAFGTILRGYTRLGYGNNLPFYENFYAGGYGSVRGYEVSSLGPQSYAYEYLANGSRDTSGIALASGNSSERGELVGGNALATFGAELILPVPFKGDWAEQIRPVIFVEGGQVFDTTGLASQTVDLSGINPRLAGLNNELRFAQAIKKDDSLRYSAGVGATWNTPIGPLSLSYAIPFGHKAGDKTEKVQFQIGSTF